MVSLTNNKPDADTRPTETPRPDAGADSNDPAAPEQTAPKEIGGRNGPDPVRYGDWEKQGRCIDF